jgi:hypothetical protein
MERRLILPPELANQKVVLLTLYCDGGSSPYLCALLAEAMSVIDKMEMIGAFMKGIYRSQYTDGCDEPDVAGLGIHSFKELGEHLQRLCDRIEDAWTGGERGGDPRLVQIVANHVHEVRRAAAEVQLHRRFGTQL